MADRKRSRSLPDRDDRCYGGPENHPQETIYFAGNFLLDGLRLFFSGPSARLLDGQQSGKSRD
jgi:hypothetical protein